MDCALTQPLRVLCWPQEATHTPGPSARHFLPSVTTGRTCLCLVSLSLGSHSQADSSRMPKHVLGCFTHPAGQWGAPSEITASLESLLEQR